MFTLTLLFVRRVTSSAPERLQQGCRRFWRGRTWASTRPWSVVDSDVQRIKAGEVGEDDALGYVTILSFEGGDLIIETGDNLC